MKKKSGAEIYLPALRKGARKLAKMSAAEIENEGARFIREFARLRAEAAKLPALRAEHERLKNEREEFIFRIAVLMELKAPGVLTESTDKLYQETVAKLALKSWKNAERIVADLALDASKAEAEAEKIAFANSHTGYERGRKLITGELKHWSRADDKLRAYLAATRGGSADEVLEHYKQHGFKGAELVELVRGFDKWWKKQKSAKAKKAGKESAKKRGRVNRKKSDKRLKEVRRHTKGYCQKCGKRVRPGQRLCNEHVTEKPQFVKITGGDLAVLVPTHKGKPLHKPDGVTAQY